MRKNRNKINLRGVVNVNDLYSRVRAADNRNFLKRTTLGVELEAEVYAADGPFPGILETREKIALRWNVGEAEFSPRTGQIRIYKEGVAELPRGESRGTKDKNVFWILLARQFPFNSGDNAKGRTRLFWFRDDRTWENMTRRRNGISVD